MSDCSLLPGRGYTECKMLFLFALACHGQLEAPKCDKDPETACFRGVFRTLLGARVEGVEVCAPEYPEISCAQTDEGGGWKIPGLPNDTDVYLTSTHPDYVDSLFPQHTSMDWYVWYKVAIPKSVMESNGNRLDVSLNAKRGHLLFLTWEGLNIDGVDTKNVSDVTASPDGNFPYLFYGNAFGLASEDLEETTGSGTGGILNIEPGETSVRLTGPAGSCAQEHMFHFEASGRDIPVPILAGFTTAIDVICPVD